MIRKLVAGLLVLLAVAACTTEQREALQTMVAAPPDAASATPALSTLPPSTSTPTDAPTVTGPLGTMTAIAHMVATPILEEPPYEIVLQGNPHFVEFYAGW
jgi:hypothetical protein